MKNYINVIVILLLLSTSMFAQNNWDTIPNPYWEVISFEIVEVDSFPLSEEFLLEFRKSVIDSCEYSQDIFGENEKVIVYVGMVIHRDGYMKGFTILKGHQVELDNEIIRVLKRKTKGKKYNTAIKSGMEVTVRFTIPFKFYKNK